MIRTQAAQVLKFANIDSSFPRFATGDQITQVDWNLWQIVYSVDEVTCNRLLGAKIGRKYAPAYFLKESRSPEDLPERLFLTLLCHFPIEKIFPSLADREEIQLSDICRCWHTGSGAIVEGASRSDWTATAIWRDEFGKFHLLQEKDTHLGKREVRTGGGFWNARIPEPDADPEDFSLWALADRHDGVQIQWHWSRLTKARDDLATKVGVANPLLLVAFSSGSFADEDPVHAFEDSGSISLSNVLKECAREKRDSLLIPLEAGFCWTRLKDCEVFRVNSIEDFAGVTGEWLAFVAKCLAAYAGETESLEFREFWPTEQVIRKFLAANCPNFGVFDGDKWTAPKLERD